MFVQNNVGEIRSSGGIGRDVEGVDLNFTQRCSSDLGNDLYTPPGLTSSKTIVVCTLHAATKVRPHSWGLMKHVTLMWNAPSRYLLLRSCQSALITARDIHSVLSIMVAHNCFKNDLVFR